jgi:hypothetical protein
MPGVLQPPRGHMRFTIDPSGNLAKASGWIDGKPIAQLVERDGYILIEQRPGKCIVWLNGAHIAPVAEAALYYFMSDSGCPTVCLVLGA